MRNGLDWLATWFAVARAGATLVPLNWRFTRPEVDYVLRQSGTRWLILEEGLGALDAETVDQLASALPGLRIAASDGAEALAADAVELSELLAAGPAVCGESTDQVGMIQYTSGSTAFPKGAMLRNGAMIRNGWNLGAAWRMASHDRVLCANPLFHCGGSVFAFLAGFTHDAAIELLPRWEVGAATTRIDTAPVTVFPAIDAMVRDLLAHVRTTRRRLPSLRLVAVPSDGQLLAKVASELGCEVSNVYGLTECSPNVAVGDLDDPLERRIAAIGRPQPGLDVQVRDPETRRVVPAGTLGVINVRGWSVMLGYHADPDATAAVVDHDGFLWTGDLGSLSADGYLSYVGRAKQMIKSGGENVSIEEVERCLLEHPAVSEAAVVPVPDERFGEVGFAVVRLHAGEHVGAEDVLAHCRTRLAGFKVPRGCEIVDDLPRVGSGKLDRRALGEWASTLRASRP
jgi:fatty-acyl-CoA synthase